MLQHDCRHTYDVFFCWKQPPQKLYFEARSSIGMTKVFYDKWDCISDFPVPKIFLIFLKLKQQLGWGPVSHFLIAEFFKFILFEFYCSSWGGGRQFSRDPLPVFSMWSHFQQFWHGQGCPLFHAIRPAFPLQTLASPLSQERPSLFCALLAKSS